VTDVGVEILWMDGYNNPEDSAIAIAGTCKNLH